MYQVLSCVQDKRFSIHKRSLYSLIISIGTHRLRIACIDAVEKRCLLLEIYQLNLTNGAISQLAAVQQVFQRHAFIASSGWAQTVICFENQQYTLVPAPLFQEQYVADYLTLAVEVDPKTVRHCLHVNLDMAVVFAAPSQLSAWLQTGYGVGRCYITHQANVVIVTAMAYAATRVPQSSQVPVVLITTEIGYVHITVVAQGRLVYYNRFAYKTTEELLQYIRIVLYTLALEPGTQEVTLTGCIGKSEPAYKVIQKYIRHLTIIEAPMDDLKFGWSFKKSLLCQHMDLLSFYPASDYLANLRFS